MTFIVETRNPKTGDSFWLRSTAWAFSIDRAGQFPTREAAQAQLDKSKQFNQVWAYKNAKIVEV